MRAKSWLIILVMGIVGMCALGLMTKFALDSNPSLQRVGRIKQAIAEDFSSQGVAEISMRALPEHRGYQVRLQAPRSPKADPRAFAEAIAECFLKKFGGPRPPFLRLTLEEPAGFGCRGPTAYFDEELSLSELAARLELRETLKRMEDSLPPGAGYRFRPTEPAEPLRLWVEIPAPKDDSELEKAVLLLREKAREHLAAGTGRTVVLSIWSRGPEARLLKEERIERVPLGRRRPLPPGALPGPARAPVQGTAPAPAAPGTAPAPGTAGAPAPAPASPGSAPGTASAPAGGSADPAGPGPQAPGDPAPARGPDPKPSGAPGAPPEAQR